MDGGDGGGEVSRVVRSSGSLGTGASVRRGSRGPACQRLLVLLAMLVAGTAITCAPALAAQPGEHTPRQHVFGFSFGSQGTGEDQFSHPAGIAVSRPTGDVYVADRENGRVEEFEPESSGGEITGEKYLAAFSIPFPVQVAVDNCTAAGQPCTEAKDPSVGDVYVAGAKGAKSEPSADNLLYKLDSSGAPVGVPRKLKNPIEGVAVGATGSVFVYEQGGTIARFSNAVANLEPKKPEATLHAETKGSAEAGFAVDAKGDFYVGSVLVSTAAGEDAGLKGLLQELAAEYELLHESHPAEPVVAKLEGSSAQVLAPALDYEATTGVAVNTADVPSNGVNEEDDVFVTNVASIGGEQVSSVAIFGPQPEPQQGKAEERHGELIQRLNAPGISEPDGIAVDVATGTVYVAGGASDTVDVFKLEPAGHPAVSGLTSTFGCTQPELELLLAGGERRDADGSGQLRGRGHSLRVRIRGGGEHLV